MSLTLSAVTLNSADPSRTAAFWSAALGGQVSDGGNGFLHVRGAGLSLIVQPAPDRRVDLPTDVHLDLHADDAEASVRELIGMGAEVVARRADSNGAWTVLRDPDGREFCVG